jgi:hypothetical protein
MLKDACLQDRRLRADLFIRDGLAQHLRVRAPALFSGRIKSILQKHGL